MKKLKQPVVFVRGGWSVYYDRDKDSEDPVGGGEWNVENIGSEAENFKVLNGRCYGYTRIGYSNAFNLSRCWPKYRQVKSYLAGVLTIIVARKPYPESGQVIVGWFKNSHIHNNCYDRWNIVGVDDEPFGGYNFEADRKDCVLLPLRERKFPIPKGAGGMGQANVYYCYEDDGTPRRQAWIGDAIEFVQRYRGRNLLKTKRR